MSFSEVIDQKLQSLQTQRKKIQDDMYRPEEHIKKVTKAISDAISQVIELEGLSEEAWKSESVSLLEQVPKLVADVWADFIRAGRAIDQEMQRWSDMKTMYENWEAQSSAARAATENAPDITDIPEPGTRDHYRTRKPGQRPEISLREHRNASAKLESGEDSEG